MQRAYHVIHGIRYFGSYLCFSLVSAFSQQDMSLGLTQKAAWYIIVLHGYWASFFVGICTVHTKVHQRTKNFFLFQWVREWDTFIHEKKHSSYDQQTVKYYDNLQQEYSFTIGKTNIYILSECSYFASNTI